MAADDEQNWSFKKEKQCHMSKLWVNHDKFDYIFTNLQIIGISLVLVGFLRVTNKFTRR